MPTGVSARPMRRGAPDGMRAGGCREALRLAAAGKALKVREAYGRMWLEIQPRGCAGIKPLRG
jgi:hypothetical protein